MFLRDQRLDALSQQRVRIGDIGIRRGFAKIGVLLVLQRFASGTVGDPKFLILVQVQHSFEHRDDYAEDTSDHGHEGKLESCEKRNCSGGDDLHDLDPLVGSLSGNALAVVPANLVFETLHDGIVLEELRGR